MNARMFALQMPKCDNEKQVRDVLNLYLEGYDMVGLSDGTTEDLFSYVEALRGPDLLNGGDIDVLTIASAVHKQFTLAELESYPTPLPSKASGLFKTEGRTMLNPKKIKDHYDLLEPLLSIFDSEKHLVAPLVRGITVYNVYDKNLTISIFSYDKCYISHKDNIVYGHLFFNRFYNRNKVVEILPDLSYEEFKFYNGRLPYIKDKTINEVIEIVTSEAFTKKYRHRNDYVGENYRKEVNELYKELINDELQFVDTLKKRRIIPYSNKVKTERVY